MTDKEQCLLSALAWMCEQCLGSGRADLLDHDCLSAGENAIAILADYDLIEVSSFQEARWTDAGKALLSGGVCPANANGREELNLNSLTEAELVKVELLAGTYGLVFDDRESGVRLWTGFELTTSAEDVVARSPTPRDFFATVWPMLSYKLTAVEYDETLSAWVLKFEPGCIFIYSMDVPADNLFLMRRIGAGTTDWFASEP